VQASKDVLTEEPPKYSERAFANFHGTGARDVSEESPSQLDQIEEDHEVTIDRTQLTEIRSQTYTSFCSKLNCIACIVETPLNTQKIAEEKRITN
jgi:hypothetical protein